MRGMGSGSTLLVKGSDVQINASTFLVPVFCMGLPFLGLKCKDLLHVPMESFETSHNLWNAYICFPNRKINTNNLGQMERL